MKVGIGVKIMISRCQMAADSADMRRKVGGSFSGLWLVVSDGRSKVEGGD